MCLRLVAAKLLPSRALSGPPNRDLLPVDAGSASILAPIEEHPLSLARIGRRVERRRSPLVCLRQLAWLVLSATARMLLRLQRSPDVRRAAARARATARQSPERTPLVTKKLGTKCLPTL